MTLHRSLLDELALAGPEHVEPSYVRDYDRKSAFDPSDDLALLRQLGLWTAAGGLINLGASSGSSYAGAVNNAGEVIGWSQTPHGDVHAALWATRLPSTADDCKNNSWQTSGAFKNQGDCVSYVAAHS